MPSAGTWRTNCSWSGQPPEATLRPSERVGTGEVEPECPPGIRLLSSAGVPSATIRPWSSTAIRSASWSASSRYCVVSRMVTPSREELADNCHMVRRLPGPSRWWARRGRSQSARRRGSWRGRDAAASARVDRNGLSAASLRSKCSNNSVIRRCPASRPRCRRSVMNRRFSRPVSRLSTAENWPVTPISDRAPLGSLITSWPAMCIEPESAGIRVEGSGPSSSCRPHSDPAARRSSPYPRSG